ncbi:hypothetical protein KIN20_020880 [Parelaphostrongylus tenuis]|uniref:Uncharacterized protein n=1 Tax=Parelaphostrongylus tenuis TaxID=148309 RepID=A0AAD5N6G6_PARTN|nr:hypothetical protein KIN20_020880 [Parelaphostrongylus tenuis]
MKCPCGRESPSSSSSLTAEQPYRRRVSPSFKEDGDGGDSRPQGHFITLYDLIAYSFPLSSSTHRSIMLAECQDISYLLPLPIKYLESITHFSMASLTSPWHQLYRSLV